MKMTTGCGPEPAGNRRSPNCCGSLPYGMRAVALGGGSLRMSWLKIEPVAARLSKDRRVTTKDHSTAQVSAVRNTFDMSSTAARAERMLCYQPPYDWAAFLRFVAPRAIPGLEHVEPGSYHRSGLTVRQHPREACLVASQAAATAAGEASIETKTRFFFDLDTDPRPIAAHLGRSRMLKKAVARHPGLRVPRSWDPFELAVRAMLGQQVTVKGASTLAGRLVERFGAPQAAVLADANLGTIGLPKTRAETIWGFARAVFDQRIRLDGSVSAREAIGRMCELPGIGPWTANYIA